MSATTSGEPTARVVVVRSSFTSPTFARLALSSKAGDVFGGVARRFWLT